MKFEINIEKKYFIGIVAVLSVLGVGVVFVVAQNTPNPGHSTSEIDWGTAITQDVELISSVSPGSAGPVIALENRVNDRYLIYVKRSGGADTDYLALSKQDNSAQGVFIRDNKVGINTATPDDELHVSGRVKISDFSASSANTDVCRNGNKILADCASSIRYKENVESLMSGLDAVEGLRPVAFEWKESGEKDFGFIAEEVEKVNPLFVTYSDGEIRGVKYRQLVAVLTNAIMEQQEQIDVLQEQIDELKLLCSGK